METLKKKAANLLKQGVAEGGEEALTSVINTVADGLVMADKSAYSRSVQEYMKTMSKEDAEKQAFRDVLDGIVYDALGGFASGTGHGLIMTGLRTGEQKLAEHIAASQKKTEEMSQIAANYKELLKVCRNIDMEQCKLSKDKFRIDFEPVYTNFYMRYLEEASEFAPAT